ncbi:MAG: SDR family NAD(P)-dependent oxidoreductase [Gammaproteobacteria bacterium]
MNAPITLITGTSKGIGKYLAEYYLNKGHIVLGCSRSAIDWSWDNYYHFEADVSNEEAVRKIFSFIRKKFGYLDNLINNAGIASMNHVVLTPLKTVTNILNTNVIGTFLFSREAAKLMAHNESGRIINLVTVATRLKIEGEAIYAASKAAVQSLTEIMARELGKLNITVNAVGLTPIDTDLIRSVPKNKIERLIAHQAIARKGLPRDVSNVIDFFLQKSSSFVTGQNLFLGGA